MSKRGVEEKVKEWLLWHWHDVAHEIYGHCSTDCNEQTIIESLSLSWLFWNWISTLFVIAHNGPTNVCACTAESGLRISFRQLTAPILIILAKNFTTVAHNLMSSLKVNGALKGSFEALSLETKQTLDIIYAPHNSFIIYIVTIKANTLTNIKNTLKKRKTRQMNRNYNEWKSTLVITVSGVLSYKSRFKF